MPKKFPAEFKRDVVAVARRGGLTRAEVAADFAISESTLQRWMRQADVDDGIKDGLTTAEQSEVVQLRRDGVEVVLGEPAHRRALRNVLAEQTRSLRKPSKSFLPKRAPERCGASCSLMRSSSLVPSRSCRTTKPFSAISASCPSTHAAPGVRGAGRAS